MEFITGLFPYQEEAVEKLSHVKVGALYMEMGTGKTRTALELIKRRLDAGKVEQALSQADNRLGGVFQKWGILQVLDTRRD